MNIYTSSEFRFRRTLLFVAILQATLPVLTGCEASFSGSSADASVTPPSDSRARPSRPDSRTAPGIREKDTASPGLSGGTHLPDLGSDAEGPAPRNEQKNAQTGKNTHPAEPDSTATSVASAASTAGGLLQSGHAGEAAASMAKGMVTGRANQTLQSWFSRAGNARVQLNADEKFSLKNSEFDLLHPWWETPENMAFSQGSLHRTDERTQANLGLGWRHWATGTAPDSLLYGNYMTGLNTFLDYDLSRDHARLGMGAEFWRDYFKAGANVYYRLTNWKNSPDIEDYEERPADGWDIRTEGWLPAYPQLGAKLTYEQYYGNDVGLFGYDNLQKDPHAFTAGLTWTPFPLMTLTAEQRQGKQGENDSRIGAEFTWHPDQSWQSQTDPDAVGAMRTLSGNRYDFVARNNNIVLEYRKKEVIAITLPDRLEGQGGMAYPLVVTLSKAKYGLDTIRWEDTDLLAAGGNIICTAGTSCTIRMPPYHATGNNTWTVGAVATDRRGNTSARVQTTVVVTGAGISASHSTLTPTVSTLLADGQSHTVVTATLKGENDQPVTGLADNLALTGTLTPDGHIVGVKTGRSRTAAGKDVKLSALKETQPGVYTATLTSGTTAGKYALSLAYAGNSLLNSQIVLTDTLADMETSTLTANKPTVMVSDGTDPANRVILTVDMKDNAGNPVTGEAGRLSLFIPAEANVDTAKITLSDLKEDRGKPGIYTGTLSSTLAVKTLPVGLKVNGKDSGKRVPVTVTADPASAKPVVAVTKDKAIADGKAADMLDISVADRFGNPLEGASVTLSAKATDNVAFKSDSVSTGPDGHAEAALTAVTPGVKTVTSTLGNKASVDVKVNFMADPNEVVQALSVKDNSGRETKTLPVGTTPDNAFTITADVLDPNGKPAPENLNVLWTLDQSACPAESAALSAGSSKTDSKGLAVIRVTSAGSHKACGHVVVSAVVEGATRSASATLGYTADAASARVNNVKLTGDRTTYLADGKDHADYRAIVTDAYGNPVSNAPVTWKTTAGTLNSPTKTGTDGAAAASLTSTTAATGVQVQAGTGNTPIMTADKPITFSTISMTGMKADAAEKTVGDDPESAFTFTAEVQMSDGKPYPGANVTWSQDGGQGYALSATQVKTDARGKAVVTLTAPSHKARKDITVTASFNNKELTSKVTWKADVASARVKTVTLVHPDETIRPANGTAAFDWTAHLEDQYGNAVGNTGVTWSTDQTGPVFTGGTVSDEAGDARAQMKSGTVVAAVHALAAAATGVTTPVTSVQAVAFVPAGAATVTTSPGVEGAVADGVTEDKFTVTVTDPEGHPVTGVSLTADPGQDTGVTLVGGPDYPLDANGKATVSLVAKVAGKHNIAISVPDSSTATKATASRVVEFVPGPVDGATSEVTIPRDAASQDTALQVNIYPRDKYHNDIPLTALTGKIRIEPSTPGVTLTEDYRQDTEAAGNPVVVATVRPQAYPFAIRDNTVTVTISGVDIAKQRPLRWSPDLYQCSDNDTYLTDKCTTPYDPLDVTAPAGVLTLSLGNGTKFPVPNGGISFADFSDKKTGVLIGTRSRPLYKLADAWNDVGNAVSMKGEAITLLAFRDAGPSNPKGDRYVYEYQFAEAMRAKLAHRIFVAVDSRGADLAICASSLPGVPGQAAGVSPANCRQPGGDYADGGGTTRQAIVYTQLGQHPVVRIYDVRVVMTASAMWPREMTAVGGVRRHRMVEAPSVVAGRNGVLTAALLDARAVATNPPEATYSWKLVGVEFPPAWRGTGYSIIAGVTDDD